MSDDDNLNLVRRGKGRPPGSPNKFTSELRQAMAEGALLSDDAKDPSNKDAPASLTQYMRNIANKYPVAFFKSLARLLPQEIRTQSLSESTLEIACAFRSIEDVKVALLDAGMTPTQVRQLEALMPDTGYQKQDTDEGGHDE